MLMGAAFLVLIDTRGAHRRAHRDPARPADRRARRAGLRLAAGARPAKLELKRCCRPRDLVDRLPRTIRRQRHRPRAGARRGALPARPQRRGQDHAVQDPARPDPARRPARSRSTAGRSPRCARPSWRAAMAYVPQAQAMEFAYTVLDLVLMGRTAHLGAVRRARPPPITSERTRGAGRSRHRRPRRGRGQPHLRRPAPALPDRPRAGPGCAAAGDGRADRQPRSRQPPAGAGARPRAARRRATASCFSTHDPDQARELATTVAVIADGRLAAYGPPQETLTGPILSAVYGVA